MSFISESLRSSQPMTSLPKVSILEIQQEIGFTDLRLVHFQDGSKVMHLVTPEEKYLTIQFGKSAKIEGSSDAEVMRSAINNNVIYTGNTDKNGNTIKRWFSFGQEGVGRVSTTVKFSDLMKEGNVLNAAAVAFSN